MCFSSAVQWQAKRFLKLLLNRSVLEKSWSSLFKVATKITASLGTAYEKLLNELHFLLMLMLVCWENLCLVQQRAPPFPPVLPTLLCLDPKATTASRGSDAQL